MQNKDTLPKSFKQLVYHHQIFDNSEKEERIKIPLKVLKSSPDIDLIYNYDDINLYIK